DHARDARVDPAAEETRHRAEQKPENHRNEGRADGDLERHLGPVENPEELVSAERRVGAEDEELRLRLAARRERVDVRPRLRGQKVWGDATAGEELVVGPVAEKMRGERRAAEGGDEEKDDEPGAGERELVPA